MKALAWTLVLLASPALAQTMGPPPPPPAPPPAAKGSDASTAQTHCQMGGNTRIVEISYGPSEARLPCSVRYLKETEKLPPQELWKSANESGYCERKALEFIERLKSLGWECKED